MTTIPASLKIGFSVVLTVAAGAQSLPLPPPPLPAGRAAATDVTAELSPFVLTESSETGWGGDRDARRPPAAHELQ